MDFATSRRAGGIRRRYSGVLLLVGAILVLLPIRATTATSVGPNRWSVGVYRGSMQPDYVRMHEQWLGRSVETVMDMVPIDSWASVTNPSGSLRAWAGKPWDIVFTTPMIPKDGVSTLAAGARGAYDDKWRSFARAMAAAGRSNARIRLGHEFNHTHYPWTAAYGREADYAAYFRRIVTVTRNEGARFRFTWNVLSNAVAADVEKAYPGDEYVDVIGLDIYDGAKNLPDFEDRWQRLLTQRYGLNWLKAFADAHDKPMSFDEWGLIKSNDLARRSTAGDSGDNTVYINRMIDFFQRENVAYACYFDWNTSHGSSDSRIIQPAGPYPNASAAYKSRVGRLSGSSPTTTRPPSTTVTTARSTTTTSVPDVSDDTVALVVGNARDLPSKDEPIRGRLRDLGYDVVAVDDDALTSAAALGGAPVVAISSSVVPGKIPSWLASHEAPVLVAEAFAQKTLGIATSGKELAGVTSLRVANVGHPVAAGLSGDVVVQQEAAIGTGTPVDDAVVIAGVTDGSTASVYAVDEGADLVSGAAPARRVGFFFSYDSPPLVGADGWKLFDAAVEWLAADAEVLPVPAPRDDAEAGNGRDDVVDDGTVEDPPAGADAEMGGGGEGRGGSGGGGGGGGRTTPPGGPEQHPSAPDRRVRVTPGVAIVGDRVVTIADGKRVELNTGAPSGATIVGGAPTRSGTGAWTVASDGRVFTSGDAVSHGSLAGKRLNAPITGMAVTPSGDGYWLLGTDGGVFSYGDARFFGSTGASRLNQPVVGMSPTPTGKGYWLFAGDGGVFTFGDARFFGSTGAMRLNAPITTIASTATGRGYWLLGSDGGVFTFGDARFFGSTGAYPAFGAIDAIVPTESGRGYWLIGRDGRVHTFGDAA